MKHHAMIAALALAGCTTSPEQRENINQTASLLAKKAASIAGQILLNSATNAIEERYSSNYIHSAAEGLRTQSLNIVSAEDVRRVVEIWTPNEPKFDALAKELSTAYAEAKAEGVAPSVAVEAVASGVQEVAL